VERFSAESVAWGTELDVPLEVGTERTGARVDEAFGATRVLAPLGESGAARWDLLSAGVAALIKGS